MSTFFIDIWIIANNIHIESQCASSYTTTNTTKTDYAKCFKIQEVRDEINKAFPNVFKFYESDSQVKE